MVLDIHSAAFVKILNVYVHLFWCGSAQCVLNGELICTSLGTITTYGSHMLQQHCDVVFNKVTSQEGLWLNLLFAWGVCRAVEEEVCPLSFQRNLDEKGCLFLNVFLVILKDGLLLFNFWAISSHCFEQSCVFNIFFKFTLGRKERLFCKLHFYYFFC